MRNKCRFEKISTTGNEKNLKLKIQWCIEEEVSLRR